MIRRCCCPGDPQFFHGGHPGPRGELRPSVLSHDARDAKSRSPVDVESLKDGVCRGVADGDGFRPASRPVYHC